MQNDASINETAIGHRVLRPSAPSPSNHKKLYNSEYDPKTVDLFGNYTDVFNEAISDRLPKDADSTTEKKTNKHPDKIENRLRQELTTELLQLLEVLYYPGETKKQ